MPKRSTAQTMSWLSWLLAGTALPQRLFRPVRIDEAQNDGREEPVCRLRSGTG